MLVLVICLIVKTWRVFLRGKTYETRNKYYNTNKTMWKQLTHAAVARGLPTLTMSMNVMAIWGF